MTVPFGHGAVMTMASSVTAPPPTSIPRYRSAPATDWTTVSAGDLHHSGTKKMALSGRGDSNTYGSIGNGSTDDQHTPVQVDSATDWIMISHRQRCQLALKKGGSLWAWGRNDFGSTRRRHPHHRTTPVQIGMVSPGKNVSSRRLQHFCDPLRRHPLEHSSSTSGDRRLPLPTPWLNNGQWTRVPATGVWSPPAADLLQGSILLTVPKATTTITTSTMLTARNYGVAAAALISGSTSLRPTGIYTIFTTDGSAQAGYGGDIPEVLIQDRKLYRIGTDTNWSMVSSGDAHALGR